MMIWREHALWNDLHVKSKNHLSLYKVITVNIDYILYVVYCILVIYYISGGLYLLIPDTWFAHLLPLFLLAATSL